MVTSWTAPMRYEPPNTFVIDDSSEYVQYLYNNEKKELRTTHEILAIMLAFEVEEITRIVARKTYSAEGLQKLCSAKIE
jgi:hypothetical protein